MSVPSADRALLLVNLGSPDSPAEPDVRKYLDEFLMDPRVLDTPWPIRRLVVSLILRKRPKESGHAYATIWTPEGSPLVVISKRTQALLAERLGRPVALAMRYGNPSIESVIGELMRERGAALREIFMVPMYPHFAMSSYETAVVEARRAMERLGCKAELKLKPAFYDDPHYIEALAESARPHLEQDYDHLLFSYHGLPERHLKKADPTGRHCLASDGCCAVASPAHATCYKHQALRTVDLFVERLGIPKEKYSIAFQSRLGRDPWIKPYTDFELVRLAQEGKKRMLVICPAFVADCLETLEEIGVRAKRDFVEAGGEDLKLIPCMNDHPKWIEALAAWCEA